MNKKNPYILLTALSLVGYAWLGWSVVEDSSSPTMCLFKTVTHLPCPSCGTTRAIVLLMQGEIATSLLVNPLGLILTLALVVVPLWIAADVFLKRDSLYRWYRAAETLLVSNKWVSIPAVAVVLLNWFWNIAKGL